VTVANRWKNRTGFIVDPGSGALLADPRDVC
jgi:hypothetical protein